MSGKMIKANTLKVQVTITMIMCSSNEIAREIAVQVGGFQKLQLDTS